MTTTTVTIVIPQQQLWFVGRFVAVIESDGTLMHDEDVSLGLGGQDGGYIPPAFSGLVSADDSFRNV